MLVEILEERVEGRRGRRVPRAVKREMSGYRLWSRSPQLTLRIDVAAAIRIVK